MLKNTQFSRTFSTTLTNANIHGKFLIFLQFQNHYEVINQTNIQKIKSNK